MDTTRLWVFAQQHKKYAAQVIVGLLLFIAGWQVGRAMSPYYAAHPIVFEEHATQDISAAAPGSPEALAALQAAGITQRERTAALASPSPAVAAAQTTSPQPSAVATTQLFVASVNSDLFHHKECATVKRIKEENQVWFATAEDAQKAGYSPSQCAKEYLNR